MVMSIVAQKTKKLTDALPVGSYPVYDLTGHLGQTLPSFKPAFTPVELLDLGIFGRNYFGGPEVLFSRDIAGLDEDTTRAMTSMGRQASGKPAWTQNYYGVKSGMDYAGWAIRGLIFDEDPVGWFHWFCRFHAGRRHMRDEHQITRHHNFVRWARNLRNQINKGEMSPVICQSLLHWSWHPGDVAAGKFPY